MRYMGTDRRSMRAMSARTRRDERLGNWLALLALLAGSIVFAPADGAAPVAGHAERCAGSADCRAITLR